MQARLEVIIRYVEDIEKELKKRIDKLVKKLVNPKSEFQKAIILYMIEIYEELLEIVLDAKNRR